MEARVRVRGQEGGGLGGVRVRRGRGRGSLKLHAVVVAEDARRRATTTTTRRERGRRTPPPLSSSSKASAAVNAETSSSGNEGVHAWGPIGSNEAIKGYTPTAAEDARTAVSLVRHGTFCTLASDTGTPFGTHVYYLVDEATGSPIIRVPSDSVEDLNLLKDGKCSLYIHPSGDASDCIARVTLMGNAVHLGREGDDSFEDVRQKFGEVAARLPPSERSFEDLVHDNDEVFRVDVEKVYVRRLACVITQQKEVEVVEGEEYQKAATDPLAFVAPYMVEKWNEEHLDDIVRFCTFLTGAMIEELEMCKLLWIDSLGLYIRFQKFGEFPKDIRMGFPQKVNDEKALVSALTMLGQVTWENQ